MKGELSPLLNLPRRNPMFTNREPAIERLGKKLEADDAVVAICGLSGIGKTQVALEYAYRHYHQYQVVLWVNAKSRETFNADMLSIATRLDLAEKGDANQETIIRAVKHWLKQEHDYPWLLILDNVENFLLIKDFIESLDQGHILLTTHLRVLDPTIQVIELERMPSKMGALLLLRRARIITTPDQFEAVAAFDLDDAQQISEIMGGLPLALDQAGAYIEETACSLSDYVELYHLRHSALLKRRGGFLAGENEQAVHSESVDTTLSLSFEKVEKAHELTTDILRLCAFLHADAIPEEIIARAIKPEVEDTPADSQSSLKTALGELAKLSLIQWDTSAETVSIHPLMQTVLKDRMNEAEQKIYVERTINAISRTFPAIDYPNWPRCQLWLAQSRTALNLMKQWNLDESLDIAHLLHETAYYSWQRGNLTGDLEKLYEQAIAVREKMLGEKHELVARSKHNYALLSRARGKYEQAERLLSEALSLRSELLGPVHADIAASLNELGWIYRLQGKYKEAEEPLVQALLMREQTLPPHHHELAMSLDSLGTLYRYLGKYDLAEKHLKRALEIREKVLKPGDPHIAQTLTNLAWLNYDKGEYHEVQRLLEHSLEIQQQAPAQHHPQLAHSLNYLGLLSCIQGKFAQADALYRRALAIREEFLGPDHPDVAQTLSNIGLLRYHQKLYDEAEQYYLKAHKIRQHLNPYHPDVSQTLNRLGQLYEKQGKFEQALKLYQETLEIREQVLGPEHPHVANCLNNLAKLHVALENYEEAEQLFQRTLAIRQRTQGAEHQLVAQTFSDLAQLYQAQRKYEKAGEYYEQALNIYNKIFDPHHPDIATVLEQYADVLEGSGQKAEAAQLRAQAREKRTEHASVDQSDVNNALFGE